MESLHLTTFIGGRKNQRKVKKKVLYDSGRLRTISRRAKFISL